MNLAVFEKYFLDGEYVNEVSPTQIQMSIYRKIRRSFTLMLKCGVNYTLESDTFSLSSFPNFYLGKEKAPTTTTTTTKYNKVVFKYNDNYANYPQTVFGL